MRCPRVGAAAAAPPPPRPRAGHRSGSASNEAAVRTSGGSTDGATAAASWSAAHAGSVSAPGHHHAGVGRGQAGTHSASQESTSSGPGGRATSTRSRRGPPGGRARRPRSCRPRAPPPRRASGPPGPPPGRRRRPASRPGRRRVAGGHRSVTTWKTSPRGCGRGTAPPARDCMSAAVLPAADCASASSRSECPVDQVVMLMLPADPPTAGPAPAPQRRCSAAAGRRSAHRSEPATARGRPAPGPARWCPPSAPEVEPGARLHPVQGPVHVAVDRPAGQHETLVVGHHQPDRLGAQRVVQRAEHLGPAPVEQRPGVDVPGEDRLDLLRRDAVALAARPRGAHPGRTASSRRPRPPTTRRCVARNLPTVTGVSK